MHPRKWMVFIAFVRHQNCCCCCCCWRCCCCCSVGFCGSETIAKWPKTHNETNCVCIIYIYTIYLLYVWIFARSNFLKIHTTMHTRNRRKGTEREEKRMREREGGRERWRKKAKVSVLDICGALRCFLSLLFKLFIYIYFHCSHEFSSIPQDTINSIPVFLSRVTQRNDSLKTFDEKIHTFRVLLRP